MQPGTVKLWVSPHCFGAQKKINEYCFLLVPPDGLVLCPRQYRALTGSHIGGVNDIPFVSGLTSST